MSKKNIFIIVTAFIILLLLGVFLSLKYFKKSALFLPPPTTRESPENKLMEGKTAIALGLAEAQKWHSDAELSYVLSADASQLKGRSDNWQLIYVSPNFPGKGFQIKITGAKISETKEISYVGQAADFPANAISQDEAVAQVKAIPGFTDVKVLGIELTYSAALKIWYWGVRTDKGTMTIKAVQNN